MSTEQTSVSLVSADVIRPFARAALLATLMGATAPLSIPIPFTTVSVTLQVLFVFLAGIYLGPLWGTASMGLYLAAGVSGLPVFAHGRTGIGPLFDYTAGFLWSFPVAACLIGVLVHARFLGSRRGAEPSDVSLESARFVDRFRRRNPSTVGTLRLVAALVAGTLLIYTMGAGYAMLLLDLSPSEAIAGFVAPFVFFELVKMAAAIGVVRSDIVPA
ncbi:biotin transporter BioY [Halovivax limisalsi]|uniref:biotin transporter BioY n=1 Tax=Halovivax limisalsi TaxID=1453760 RepID=UPI001FFD1E51|nr:biotin transporter BioY [Halovivax limisalsi]